MPRPAGPDPRRWLAAARDADGWLRSRDYAGYDPHDFLSSPIVRALTFGNLWLAVAWTQLGKRSRIQLRPLLGVRPARNPKAIGLAIGSYVRLADATGDARYRSDAAGMLSWLAEHTAERLGYPGGWGYPFPWANRDFQAPAGTPSSVVTAFVGHALLDAAEAFGWEEARILARRGAEFVRRSLNRIPGPNGTHCFSYTPLDRRGVHNANVLAASLLARVGAAARDPGLREDALRAARFSVRAQRPDGSWPYGLGARNGWVDGFHTGYTLVALHEIDSMLGTDEFSPALDRGLEYWRRAFLRGPAVGFRPGRPYPIDTHAVAHAIVMLIALRDRAPDALPTARRLADWCLREMRDPGGHYFHLRHRSGVNRIPYARWVQAWMLRALAELVLADARADGPAASRADARADSRTESPAESSG